MNIYAVINGIKREATLLEMYSYRARFYAARVKYNGETHVIIRFPGVSGWRDWRPEDGTYKMEKPAVKDMVKNHADF